MNRYHQAKFLKSAAFVHQLPADTGYEVAFAGRSNAGKSSALNAITNCRQLAKTSKTPGRTQLMNVFTVGDEQHRLIDLPGYGYAKVPEVVRAEWLKRMIEYIERRQSLQGIIILMDIRHPLTSLDDQMLELCIEQDLKVHIVLTKADKLSRNQVQHTLFQVEHQLKPLGRRFSVQVFSALKKQGIDALAIVLDTFLMYNQ